MKSRTLYRLFVVMLLFIMILTGCWNYREVDKLTIVAGFAIDKGKQSKYQITVEIVEISGGMESKPISRTITIYGNTIFDAVRNEISLSGKKLYWGHNKVVILSKEIAKEGALGVADWINRDSETRSDVLLLVSKEKTAKEILEAKGVTNDIVSFELAEMAKNEKSLSKAPITELWEFVNELEALGMVATLPSVNLKKSNHQYSPQILGTAVFQKDKLLGFLGGKETKNFLFLLDKVKGGLLITNEHLGNLSTPVTLEIFKNKTKIKPIIKQNRITFDIQIKTTVALDEVSGSITSLDEKTIESIKKAAEEEVKSRVVHCVKLIQKSYGVDIFGFGSRLREEKPNVWNKVARNWEKGIFKDVKVNVKSAISIKGTGMLSKTIEKAE